MLRALTVVGLSLGCWSCIDVSLPEAPPPPGPGTLQGTAVFSVPGRTGTRPAGGTRIALLGSSRATVADAESGRFVLDGLTQSTGRVLFAFDADGDGTPERQRVLELSVVGAGPGKNIALGEVVLSRNATVVGRALRSDEPRATGHAGIAVFAPGAPYATTTADTGDFVLENLPEGPLQLAFFRAGYATESRDLSVRGGEEARVAEVALVPSQAASAVVATGVLRFDDGTPVASARVRFESARVTFTAMTDATGAFSAQTTSAAVYQVGIEADGAVSLRLYNVLLLPGPNDLGALQLARGTSTPLSLDGGLGDGPDGGSAGPIAAIDPAVLELAPGGQGALSSARSAGQRPLQSRWRNAGDGGLALTFAAPDTNASVVQVFAPDAAGLYPVSLRVTDLAGFESPEARSVVRVGSRPTVSLSATAGTSVAPGAPVELVATAQSTDGRPVTDYRWRQVTGPPIVIPQPTGPMLTFAAPLVAGLTPMTFEAVVATDTGFESAPASLTLALQPVTGARVVATATPSVVVFDGGRAAVRLTANVLGGPVDGGWSFSWSPSAAGCQLPDGGIDLTCSQGWTLSNPSAQTTEFFAPAVLRDDALSFTVTANLVGGAQTVRGQVDVTVLDRRPPACSDRLSRLSYSVVCDEAVLVGGLSFDAGPDTPPYTLEVDGGAVDVLFARVLDGGLQDVSMGGLTDAAGNAPVTLRTGPALAQLSAGPRFVSVATSTTDPRPVWLSLPGPNGGPRRRLLVGRRTTASERMVWTLDPATCTPSCATADHERIPMAGTVPGPSTSAVVAGDRAYVIVSSANPPGLVEYADGGWREVLVTRAPSLFALSRGGPELSVLSLDGGALARYPYLADVNGGSFGPPDVVDPMLLAESAELVFTPRGKPFVVAVEAVMMNVSAFEYVSGPLWNFASAAPMLPSSQATSVKAVLWGESIADGFIFTRVSDGSVEAHARDVAPSSATLLTVVGLSDGTYDVARFGQAALVARSTDGDIELSLVSLAPGVIHDDPILTPDGGLRWSTPGMRASWPRLTVQGAEVWLSWQEDQGTNGPWRMAGTSLR